LHGSTSRSDQPPHSEHHPPADAAAEGAAKPTAVARDTASRLRQTPLSGARRRNSVGGTTPHPDRREKDGYPGPDQDAIPEVEAILYAEPEDGCPVGPRSRRQSSSPGGTPPTWVGVGGSPQSVIRAARYGLPLMLAVIGGDQRRFAPYVDLYKRALDEYGHSPLPVGMHSLGYVAETDEEAVDMQWPYWAEIMDASARERGWAPPTIDGLSPPSSTRKAAARAAFWLPEWRTHRKYLVVFWSMRRAQSWYTRDIDD
jgi:alkanesulfonate monooxygenase SsuD/methylene tetrahydromethanopterin reductase-like flavin-dependent oxidoreductase (luciferase family)